MNSILYIAHKVISYSDITQSDDYEKANNQIYLAEKKFNESYNHKIQETTENNNYCYYTQLETIEEHLHKTANMCSMFTDKIDCSMLGYLAGVLHDIGKYSLNFQKHIKNSDNSLVDHSTAGAKSLYYRAREFKEAEQNVSDPQIEQQCKTAYLMLLALSYAIAGHHSGLPQYSDVTWTDTSTLCYRVNKKEIDAYIDNIDGKINDEINDILHNIVQNIFSNKWTITDRTTSNFSFFLFTKMLYSSLVDADYLATESFMDKHIHQSRETYHYDSYETLSSKLDDYIDTNFGNPTEKINKIRCEILQTCIDKAKEKPGIFTLAAQCGSGKTVSAIAFALNHIKNNNEKTANKKLERIIYVAPYTSIIDQNSKKYIEIFNEKNIIEHFSSFDINEQEGYDEKLKQQLKLATENWDSPIISTTTVQFFESLYSNKASKNRKLHNIVNSVIILDEVQALPTKVLYPCINVLSELTKNYNCSIILCSATQPEWDPLFDGTSSTPIIAKEKYKEYEQELKRCTYDYIGSQNNQQLVERLGKEHQALCIVNSKKQAKDLFNLLPNEINKYHLSTSMYAQHRLQIINQIQDDLSCGKECIVISTSLVEAGVDFDFETVYRQMAGIDSIIQAGGRCNRNLKKDKNKSKVFIFDSDNETEHYNIPQDTLQKASISRSIFQMGYDLNNDEETAVKKYFIDLYSIRGHEKNGLGNTFMNEHFGKENYRLGEIPYRDISQDFKLIENNTINVVIRTNENEDILNKMSTGHYVSKNEIRRMQKYTVQIYDNQFNQLSAYGCLERYTDDMYLLNDNSFYDEKSGLITEVNYGNAIIL